MEELSSGVCEKIGIDKKWKKVIDVTELGVVVCVLAYRVYSIAEYGVAWGVALACEAWFGFELLLLLSTWWTPVETRAYPEKLLKKVGDEVPSVDMFVTTADAEAEPAIVTVNTVLSLMAVEYPAHKLACYVSDDASSPLLLHALRQALPFARLWIPFCKKYGLQLRAPFMYFASHPHHASPEFLLQWTKLKDEYEKLSLSIEQSASKREFATATDKGNHPSMVKVISENKEGDPLGLPHLIYVCREKRPDYPHHYKAGAMNVLTRVSGVMTNAPYMLNVDCDMFANNPMIVLEAMCSFLGLRPQDCAFVQFPQAFYNNLKDDPFGNQMAIGFEVIGRGMAGIQGPPYVGTGCFHRRKLIYGFSIEDSSVEQQDTLKETFGRCGEFAESLSGAARARISSEAAEEVCGCDYEQGTAWGKRVGWGYGSITEDVLTGMRIHARGWNSVSLMPDRPGFLGMAPSSGPTTLVQRKRWTTGLLQVLVGHNTPFLALIRGRLRFRQALAYTWILNWGIRAVFYLCYTILPAYSILANSPFLPKPNEPPMLLFVAQFMIHHSHSIYSYLNLNQSTRCWWNNLRMVRINSVTCDLFGALSFVLQLLGVSDIAFDVTQKDQSADNAGRFTFDESPMFVPATTILFLHFAALAMCLVSRRSFEIGELLSSVWVVLCFWPFVRGLFGTGKYGIPLSTILKSAFFAFLFVQLCTHTLIA